MKAVLSTVLLGVALLVSSMAAASAHEGRAFRIMGPVPATINEVRVDGTITWSNDVVSGSFTVQAAANLHGEADWQDLAHVPASNAVTFLRVFDPDPPAGMVFIPAGAFAMGNVITNGGTSDEVPVRQVYINTFYIDRTEVTTAMWEEVKEWSDGYGYGYDHPGLGRATNHPVHSISWYDAVKWCNARSEREGMTPVYYADEEHTKIYKTNAVAPYALWEANGYRLPTEAEWEKAARGGRRGLRFPWGDTIDHSVANYLANGSVFTYDVSPYVGNTYHPVFNDGGHLYTGPVGSFPPTGYVPGLYDMAGNVWEWCWDWYGAYDSSGPPTNPRGPTSGSVRVERGGGWETRAPGCRSAERHYGSPIHGSSDLGFRCVRSGGS